MRSTARPALVLAACCVGSALPVSAQVVSREIPSSPTTVVVVLPARADSMAASRVARAISGREVVAVYTTDTPRTYDIAHAVHLRFGGSLIPYDRLSRSPSDVSDLLFHNAVENAASHRRGQAVLVVADSDLALPLLRRAVEPRSLDTQLETTAESGFVISLGQTGSRSVDRLRF